jgi:hypothetical protein
MKKLIFAFLLLVCGAVVTSAFLAQPDWPRITFQAAPRKPVTGGNPVPKTPVTFPEVYLDDHILYLDSIGYDCTIQLTDGTETVVYSVFVPDATTTVVLPSTLTGTFELSLIPETGYYYFYSEITF